jgi:hypothetical protein
MSEEEKRDREVSACPRTVVIRAGGALTFFGWNLQRKLRAF